MPNKKPRRPTDINQLAAFIAAQITSAEAPHLKVKNAAAVALGRLGGLKGGKARAAKLTPLRRKAIAREAALKRWAKK